MLWIIFCDKKQENKFILLPNSALNQKLLNQPLNFRLIFSEKARFKWNRKFNVSSIITFVIIDLFHNSNIINYSLNRNLFLNVLKSEFFVGMYLQ
jgi:hypothetical protein